MQNLGYKLAKMLNLYIMHKINIITLLIIFYQGIIRIHPNSMDQIINFYKYILI